MIKDSSDSQLTKINFLSLSFLFLYFYFLFIINHIKIFLHIVFVLLFDLFPKRNS